MEQSDARNAIVLISKNDGDEWHWPPEVVEYAFNAWAFLDNRNCVAVRERMRSGEFCLNADDLPVAYDVPIRTIQNWVKSRDWIGRHEQFIQETAPGILKVVVGNMMRLAVDGSHVMATQARAGIPPSKDMTEAVKLATSVLGLSAIGSRDPSKGVLSGGSANRRARSLRQLSDDELLEAERMLAEPED